MPPCYHAFQPSPGGLSPVLEIERGEGGSFGYTADHARFLVVGHDHDMGMIVECFREGLEKDPGSNYCVVKRAQ